ncbi:hypothetical protein BDQ17DRAFT_1333969 [Cyathus striatus]|nr:hypothetical protein BDQ17DRAFT_1333969 [Cyathus striatus]
MTAINAPKVRGTIGSLMGDMMALNNKLRDQDDSDSQFTVEHNDGEVGYDRHQCFRSIGMRNNELRDQDDDEYDLKKWMLLELVTQMLLECYLNVTEPKIPDLELSFVSLAKKNSCVLSIVHTHPYPLCTLVLPNLITCLALPILIYHPVGSCMTHHKRMEAGAAA